MDKFDLLCNEINEVCKSLQEEEKEKITDLKAFKAYSYIKNMYLEDVGDALLFCASMNLINTYVKQNNSKLGYRFKTEFAYLIGICANVGIQNMKIYLDKKSRNPLLLVQFGNLQFSFHNVPLTKELLELSNSIVETEFEWDGIRKQQCADTIFDMAERNRERRCFKTFRGKNLEKKINSLVNNFKQDKIGFEY